MSNLKKINEYIENIISEPLEDIVSERFGRYSKYIIQDRALPDARDGLKPVQRRILYAMNELDMKHNKPYKKSARIAGEVMGKYHPHGDLSIYEAMVRLSQDWKMLVPLIDMHGNNGSIDGDSAAAMRYTEARLSLPSEYLLKDLDKKTVPFVPNFDDEEIEPVVLPAKFPNLLVNGAHGISAGYATKIPPHNLGEIIDLTIHYIDNEKMDAKDVLKFVKGPDFPTGGIVQGKDGILQAIKTGSGRVIVRAKTGIEDINKTQQRIVITEIPYEVNKSELVRSIDMLRVDKKVEDIIEVRDETDQEGLRIAIDLKRGAAVQTILTYLFRTTNLQVAFNYNLVSILNNRPIQSGFLPVIKAYIDHQKEVITNRSNYELERAKRRLHIVEGLIKMVSVVEEIIKIIRKSKNKAESKSNIEERFGFSEVQSEAIVTLQLYRLSNTDILALEKEANELNDIITNLTHILSHEKALRKVIKDELKETKQKLATPRLTVIESEIESLTFDETKLISEEQVMLAITKDGYVKKSSLRSYNSTQNVGLKQDDVIIFEKEVSTIDTLLIFLQTGNYIYVPVHRLDDQRWGDQGLYIGNIVDVERDERVIYATTVNNFDINDRLLVTTKKGNMKQIKISDLEVSRFSRSMRYMRIQKNDEVASIDDFERKNIIVLTKNGYGLQFLTEDMPTYGLAAGGIKAIALTTDDEVVEALYANPSDDLHILTVRGHILKDNLEEIPVYNRNRRGIRVVPVQKSNPHEAVSLVAVTNGQYREDKLTIYGTLGSMKIPLQEVRSNPNKYGKLVFDEKLGSPYYLSIPKDYSVLDERVKHRVSKQATLEDAPIIEETIKSKDKTIKISRLDLFDEE